VLDVPVDVHNRAPEPPPWPAQEPG